jgi:hypothetical protein
MYSLFLARSGTLYLKVQDLLAHDEAHNVSPSPTVGKRRAGPKHPKYGLPTEQWPMIIHRVVENKEPLRAVAQEYGVSHETIRRVVRAARCGSKASVRTDMPRSQHRGSWMADSICLCYTYYNKGGKRYPGWQSRSNKHHHSAVISANP